MFQFKVTAVATMVTTILASTQIQASEQTRFFNAPSVSSYVKFNPQMTQQRALAERRTVSGHKSTFDAQLGKATFLWQAVGQAKPNMAVVLPEQRNAYAADFYLNALTGVSTAKKGAANAVLIDLTEQKLGSITAKYKQQVHGVEVFNREYNLIMDKEHNLVAGSGYFATSSNANRSLAPLAGFVGAEQSIKQAIKNLADINVSLTKSVEQGDYVKYTVTSQSGDKVVLGQPRAKKVFFEVNSKLESAYYVEVEIADKNSLESDYFSYVIGAQNNKIYFKKT